MAASSNTTRTRARSARKSGDGYHPAETKSALLESALALFEERGYPATSVEDIVVGAGLTKGAFYHHFGSKEEVLQIIHDTYIDNELEVCRRIMDEFDDPRAQVREIIRASVLDLAQFRSHISVYMQDRRFLTGERRQAVLAKRDSIDQILQGAIQSGIDQGMFRPEMTARLAGLGIIGMCAWVIQWWRPTSRYELEEIADQYVAMILSGLDQPT